MTTRDVPIFHMYDILHALNYFVPLGIHIRMSAAFKESFDTSELVLVKWSASVYPNDLIYQYLEAQTVTRYFRLNIAEYLTIDKWSEPNIK